MKRALIAASACLFLGSAVLAVDSDLTRRTAEDPLAAAVVARHVDRHRVAGEHRSTRSASISRLITNALPVCRWQLRQWQQWTKSGSEASR